VPQGTPSGRRRLRRTTGRIVWDDLVLAEFSPPAAAESATGAEFPLGEVATGDVVKAITASVSSSPLLSELDGELVTYLIDCGTLSFRRAGTVIFAEGEAGASLFLILRGRCRVERRGPAGTSLELATLRPGAFFGELAVLTDAPRSTTVRAVDDVTLLEVSRAVLRELIGREPAVLRLLLRFFRARMVGALLATSPLFTSLQAAAHRDWVSRFRLSEVPAREYVLRRGAAGRGLHVVLAGELSVRAPEPGADDTLLAVLGPGEVFGEMSLLGDGLATADVRTELRSWLLWLPRDDFFELIAHRPGVREALEMLAERRRAANRELLPPVEPV
jgi:CRP-like cAMP-binding protein